MQFLLRIASGLFCSFTGGWWVSKRVNSWQGARWPASRRSGDYFSDINEMSRGAIRLTVEANVTDAKAMQFCHD